MCLPSGSLHFTHVLPSDNTSSSSLPFICVVYNPLLRSLVQGSDQRIEVLPGKISLYIRAGSVSVSYFGVGFWLFLGFFF